MSLVRIVHLGKPMNKLTSQKKEKQLFKQVYKRRFFSDIMLFFAFFVTILLFI